MNFRLIIYVFAFFFSQILSAQEKQDPSTFAKTITPGDLKVHLNIIAGADMEGRNTPSPGLEKAADYISAQFKRSGLLPGNKGSFRQTYPLIKDSVAETGLEINGVRFKPGEDFMPGFNMPENLDIKFESGVFARYGIVDGDRDDYRGTDIKGKLVIFLEGQPDNYKPSQSGRLSPASMLNKIRNASSKGAAAILVIRDPLPSNNQRTNLYRPAVAREGGLRAETPVFYISDHVVSSASGHSLDEIKGALSGELQIPMVTDFQVVMRYRTVGQDASASNVIGIVEGSDKKHEFVIVTAHYDHVGKDAQGNIYYGADDDGSGTVAIIEIAKAFAKAKQAGKGPRRTMVFMTVSGEEKGLWGSGYYSTNPVFPLEKTSADLNIDMIGRIGTDYLNSSDAENYVYVVGDDKLSTDLMPVLEKVNGQYTKLRLDRKFNDPADPERIYYRSDHYSFASKGVPAVFFFNGIHADYHRITDTVDKINFALLAKRAQLVFYAAWEIANREQMMKRDLKLPVQ